MIGIPRTRQAEGSAIIPTFVDGRKGRERSGCPYFLSWDGHETVNAQSRDHQAKARTINCIECGCSSGLYWHGWRAYRTDDPEVDEPPALAFYCPTCAAREFDAPSRHFER